MAELRAKKRNALGASAFAVPGKRKLPIHDAAHAKNARARLGETEGLTAEERAEALRRIEAAERRFGVTAAKKRAGKRLHIRADIASGGSLHVRHLDDSTGGKLAVFRGLVELGDNARGKGPVWIQVAKAGVYKGHTQGAFTLDGKAFGEIVDNFNATTNHRIPVDFEHASEAAPSAGSIPVVGAPAQGWITKLEQRGGELWGLVDWLDRAREYIEAGQYRYFSPAIRFGARDRMTNQPIGARMTSGALTNTPFLDGMQSLAARDFDAEPATPAEQAVTLSTFAFRADEYLPKLRAALRCGELDGLNEMSARCARLRDLYTACGDAHGMADGVSLAPFTSSLREAMGAPLHADVHDLLDAVDEMIDAAMARHIVEDHAALDDDADTDPDAAAMSDRTNEEPSNMAEKTFTLAEHESALSTATASLSLQLKDAQSEVTRLSAEVVTLKDAVAKRDAADLDARVDEAFLTYRDAKKLGDADKKAMRIVLASDRETFDKLYPRVAPAQQHLLRVVAVGGNGADGAATPTAVTMSDRIAQHQKAGLSLEAATSKAFAEATAARG